MLGEIQIHTEYKVQLIFKPYEIDEKNNLDLEKQLNAMVQQGWFLHTCHSSEKYFRCIFQKQTQVTKGLIK